MESDSSHSLKVLQIGMHERGAGGGVDRFFWDLFDNLKAFPELSLKAFYFRHQGLQPGTARDEACVGSTDQPGYRRLWNLRRAALRELEPGPDGPSLVVSHFALYAAALLPRLSQVPHVVHFQGPWSTESAIERKNRLNVTVKYLVEHAVYSSANAFITLSHAFRELLTTEYKVRPELVHVIPPAVDLDRFVLGDRQAARELLGWPQDAIILLCVRRLARRMGLEILIEAFKQIADAHPQSLLFFGGAGSLRDELAARIESNGLNRRVRLLGFIPEDRLAISYQAADLSIVPSQSLEGFGLTALESLACGTPIVVTPVGGLPEAVSGFAPQLVLPDRSATALAATLDSLLCGELAVPSRAECRQHVETNFGWPRICMQIKALYQEVANS
jgi:glycosyltransferase involved in cell wall biosynthesis